MNTFSDQLSLAGDSSDTNHLVVLFCGDLMGHDAQIRGAYDPRTKKYNYEPSFKYIKDYLTQADISIGNLEVTLAGPPFKGYPKFSSPDAFAEATRDAGFDILVTANNHALDRGSNGFIRTLNTLDSLQFLRAGTYHDSIDRDSLYPLIFEKNNIRIALLNYTYGTNGLKVDPPLIVNRIDTVRMGKDIEKAKRALPDYIIVFIHWGKEYERTENVTQKNLAKFFIHRGVDAVIGSHPHVVQPIRLFHIEGDTISPPCPVVYSLGNFISNQRARYKDGGIVAEIHLLKHGNITSFDHLYYLPYWVWRKDTSHDQSDFFVLPVARYESDTSLFKMNAEDIYRLKRFARDTRNHLKDVDESKFYEKK